MGPKTVHIYVVTREYQKFKERIQLVLLVLKYLYHFMWRA